MLPKKIKIELDEKAIKHLEKLSLMYRERKSRVIDMAHDNIYREVALMAALCVLDLYEEEVEKQGMLPGMPYKISTS